MRRTISQFLAKMGSLIDTGYLTADEFFTANPEAGRQLAVLTFIEKAIQEYWAQSPSASIAEWDRPFPKFEFNTLWPLYEEWFRKHGVHKLYLAPPTFANQAPTKPT